MQEIYNVKEMMQELKDRYAGELFCIEDFCARNLADEDDVFYMLEDTANESTSDYHEDLAAWLGRHFDEAEQVMAYGHFSNLESLLRAAQIESNRETFSKHASDFTFYYALDCLDCLGVENVSGEHLEALEGIARANLFGSWGDVKKAVTELINEEEAE